MKSYLFFLAVILILPLPALADDDHHEGTKHLPAVANASYKNSCGSCHFAYQPGLLPARSWVKIIDEPGAHPGGDVSLDEKTKSEVKNYLTRNSAENSQAKRSRKIMDSIGSDTPVRISEVPYIRHKHDDINQEVFARKAIGSRANCIACHKSAESGVYEDDDVVIPTPTGDHAARETGRYESKFYGIVDDLPQDRIGVWVVNGRQIVVTRDTRIKEKHGRPEPGAYVEVEGSNTGTTFTASEIAVKRAKTEPEPERP